MVLEDCDANDIIAATNEKINKKLELQPRLFGFYAKRILYSGLPVYIIYERVNRYTLNFMNILTAPETYGILNVGG